MYILGHIALAYLIVLAFFAIKRERMAPAFMLSLFFFSCLPDIFHLGPFRMYSHNLLGGTILFAVFAYMFVRWNLVEAKQAYLLGLAYGIHAIGDTLFSTYYWQYPFSTERSYAWMYIFHTDYLYYYYLLQTILFIIFMVAFVASGDWGRLRTYCSDGLREIRARYTRFRTREFYGYYLSVGLVAWSVIQIVPIYFSMIGASAHITYFHIHTWPWYMVIAVAFYIVLFVGLLFKRAPKDNGNPQ